MGCIDLSACRSVGQFLTGRLQGVDVGWVSRPNLFEQVRSRQSVFVHCC